MYRSSYKHYTYRDYKTAGSAGDCAGECRATTWCNSISFRYSPSGDTSDIGNCLLSDTKGEYNNIGSRDFGSIIHTSIYS